MLALAALLGAVAQAPQDTVPRAELTLDGFYARVVAHHPLVRQARLLEEQARAELLAARGELYEPVLAADWDRKVFGSKEYYDYVTAGLKIPTPIGIDVKLGYENTQGQFINPDRGTPAQGLLVAGVSIPLGQGLLNDARRNAVQQAEALRDAAIGERQAAVNKFLLVAVKEYAGWYEAWRRADVAREGVELAAFRFRAVQSRFANGDAAAIDTVEAALELRRREVTRLEADNGLFVATQAINAYLWDDRGLPVDLLPGTVPSRAGLEPDGLDLAAIDTLIVAAVRQHPDVQKALAKLRQARANRSFYGQELLPELTLQGAAIGDNASTNFLSGWPTLESNYKVGGTFKLPLLLMKERGKFNAAGAKLETQELDLALTQREVRLVAVAAANEVGAFGRILGVQQDAVAQARALRDGEVRRFENGESTLFLVNTRDRTVLDEQVKLAAYEAKYAGARASLAVALGLPAAFGRPLPPTAGQRPPQ